MHRLLLIFPLIATVCFLYSCTDKATEKKDRVFPAPELGEAMDTIGTPALEKWVNSHPDDIDALNVLYGRYGMSNEHDKLIQHARPLFQKAMKDGNDILAIYTGTYIGQSFSLMFKPNSMYRYFDLIYDKAKRLVRNYDTWINTPEVPSAEQKIQSALASGIKTDPENRLSEIFITAEHFMKDMEVFRDSELTIDSLAKKINTNQAYLSRAINTYAKSSFRDYVNTYRIRYAVKLLSDIDNDQPIKDIAAQAGYNNLQSFYQNFRKETDVPPSRYRETIRKLKKEQQN